MLYVIIKTNSKVFIIKQTCRLSSISWNKKTKEMSSIYMLTILFNNWKIVEWIPSIFVNTEYRFNRSFKSAWFVFDVDDGIYLWCFFFVLSNRYSKKKESVSLTYIPISVETFSFQQVRLVWFWTLNEVLN